MIAEPGGPAMSLRQRPPRARLPAAMAVDKLGLFLLLASVSCGGWRGAVVWPADPKATDALGATLVKCDNPLGYGEPFIADWGSNQLDRSPIFDRKAAELCEALAGDPEDRRDDVTLFVSQGQEGVLDTAHPDYFDRCVQALTPRLEWMEKRNLRYWRPAQIHLIRKEIKPFGLSLGAFTKEYDPLAVKVYFMASQRGGKKFVNFNLDIAGGEKSDRYIGVFASHEAGHLTKDDEIHERELGRFASASVSGDDLFSQEEIEKIQKENWPQEKIDEVGLDRLLALVYSLQEIKDLKSRGLSFQEVLQISINNYRLLYVQKNLSFFRQKISHKDRSEYDRLVKSVFGDFSKIIEDEEQMELLDLLFHELLRYGQESYHQDDVRYRMKTMVEDESFKNGDRRQHLRNAIFSFVGPQGQIHRLDMALFVAMTQEAGLWSEVISPAPGQSSIMSFIEARPDGSLREVLPALDKHGQVQDLIVSEDHIRLLRIMIRAAAVYHDPQKSLASFSDLELAPKGEAHKGIRKIYLRENSKFQTTAELHLSQGQLMDLDGDQEPDIWIDPQGQNLAASRRMARRYALYNRPALDYFHAESPSLGYFSTLATFRGHKTEQEKLKRIHLDFSKDVQRAQESLREATTYLRSNPCRPVQHQGYEWKVEIYGAQGRRYTMIVQADSPEKSALRDIILHDQQKRQESHFAPSMLDAATLGILLKAICQGS